MPLIRVEIREGWSHPEKVRLLDAIHAAAVEVLKIPDEEWTQILTEHAAEAFEFPPGKGERFTLVEVTMFAGRSPDAKRQLYRAVVRNLGRLGVPSSDVLIVLHEAPWRIGVFGAERQQATWTWGSRSVSDRRWWVLPTSHARPTERSGGLAGGTWPPSSSRPWGLGSRSGEAAHPISPDRPPFTTSTRVWNVLSFFTIWSNTTPAALMELHERL